MPLLIYLKQTFRNLRVVYITTNKTFKSPYFKKYCSTTSKDNKTVKKSPSKEIQKPLEPPEEPTTCCMSGCANCVWLDYAEALCKYYQDGGEEAIKEINSRISDPNIKAYILHEIRMKNRK